MPSFHWRHLESPVVTLPAVPLLALRFSRFLSDAMLMKLVKPGYMCSKNAIRSCHWYCHNALKAETKASENEGGTQGGRGLYFKIFRTRLIKVIMRSNLRLSESTVSRWIMLSSSWQCCANCLYKRCCLFLFLSPLFTFVPTLKSSFNIHIKDISTRKLCTYMFKIQTDSTQHSALDDYVLACFCPLEFVLQSNAWGFCLLGRNTWIWTVHDKQKRLGCKARNILNCCVT